MALALTLTVLGGLAELIGLALVAVEIRKDRRLAQRYLAELEQPPSLGFRGQPVRPEIQMMEQFQRTHGPIERRLEATQENLGRQVERTTRAAESAAHAQRAAFLNFVRDLLQGGLGQRKIGAGLFGVGVVLNVTGNVLAATCG